MVVNLGLDAVELAAFEAAMCSTHRMRVTGQITDLNRVPLVDISGFRKEGQVNVDSSQSVTRSATVDLFDPTHVLGFDTASPTDGAVAPKYALRLSRGVFVEVLDRWVDVPVFWGPITKPSRVGDVLTIEAQGFEARAQRLAWEPYNVKADTNRADVIRSIMRDRAGEAFFRISTTTAQISKDHSITRDDAPWDLVKKITDGMNWELFYDAEAYLVARPKSTAPVWTFRTGVGGSLKSATQLGYEDAEVTNLAYFTGGTPKGKTKPITAVAVAPATHPLSPLNLGTALYPDYRRHDVSDDTITTSSKAQSAADAALAQILLTSLTVRNESLPILHLEEGDTVAVVDDVSGFTIPTTMRTWTIPLNCDGSQSNGFLRRVSRTNRAVRGVSRTNQALKKRAV